MLSDPPIYYLFNDDGTPVPTRDVREWSAWFKTAQRVLARDTIDDGIEVSTVFLGLDHNFGATGPAILWETLIFGGPRDGEMWRYATRAEALAGHVAVVADLRSQRSGDG